MTEWGTHGYFTADLKVCSCKAGTNATPTRFVPLKSLGPKPFEVKQKRGVVLSCPCCFTVLSYSSRRHSKKKLVVFYASEAVNCRIKMEQRLEPEAGSSLCIPSGLFPVFCKDCGADVGVFDVDERAYQFFRVIPGF